MTELHVNGPEWQGHQWRHDLIIQTPREKRLSGDTAFLVITGDRVDPVDLPFGQKLANLSGLPVATLFDVPNQPLYDRREDDLIAYTFEQYLDTGDDSWPLLKPMVRSAVLAMDEIQRVSNIKHFIVTGESKRGWTTWLVGELNDPRVLGIAPVSFDNLDFGPQLQHQMQIWGHLSDMLGSYTGEPVSGSKGYAQPNAPPSQGSLIERMNTDRGHQLVGMVDPIFGLSNLHVPVLAIRGSNDPYWAVDAGELYWQQVPTPKAFLVLPNVAHNPGESHRYLQALAHFVEQCRNPKLLGIESTFSGGKYHCHWSVPAREIKTWAALSSSQDFRNSHWSAVKALKVPARAKRLDVDIEPQEKQYEAIYLEFVEPDGSSLTTIPHVLKPEK